MNSNTPRFFLSSNVRNRSEKAEAEISMPSTKSTLSDILDDFNRLIDYKDKQDLYADIAGRLSKIAKKSPVWGWRYIQSVFSGTVEPSKKFSKAVDVLAVSIDGVPINFAKAAPVTVYAETNSITEGAYIMMPSRRCANSSCSVEFVPNVPWRRYCPICRPCDE